MALVAGFGSVGCRKIEGLLKTDIQSVLVLDMAPNLSDAAKNLAKDPRVRYERRKYGEKDIRESFIVFAATSSFEENRRISELCRIHNVLCNCATEPDNGNFIVPAVIRQGGINIAVSTTGQSPALARQMKEELSGWLDKKEPLLWLMGKLREPILNAGLDSAQNTQIFRAISKSPLQAWLVQGEIEKCRTWLESLLPSSACHELDAILTEYTHVHS